ncbi:pentapeptide repeat protein [Thalassoporum mexicanum PCC 7367]|uniref:pentapeptide repeat-containing protein n=1 Tax=Thalassoporum mexicanum TaxID=3457544 RepID=UPI00029FC747|nr:pentapeptide repeat-containing protein [Pseudanabaena sp. PCC 7367]AFY68521.1 pentapeptide repeat protein [Pseudanabaena sp. PCC 7367]
MISESWPLNIDFTAAVQNPQICFQDEQLRRSHPAKNQRGRMLLWSGNFATVYKLCNQEQSWAVRCFTRAPQFDVQERYARIGDHLRQSNLPYLVDFEFIDHGILVQGQWYPILKMDWIDGQELDLYIGEHINDAKELLSLDQKLKQLKSDLRSAGIGHGDLQHGNIMVTNGGELKLVDYDGMYVPALRGNPPIETGHPNYQAPARSPHDFDESVDEFSFDVISLSLHALAQQPQLWQSFHEDNKNLIFRQDDFKEPESSPVFQSIATIEDPATKKLRSQLIRRCRGDMIVVEPPGLWQRLKSGHYLQTLKTGSASLPRSQWLMLTAVVGLTLGLSALMATIVISTLSNRVSNRGSIPTQPSPGQPTNSETNPDATDSTATSNPAPSPNANNDPEIVLAPITAAELLSAYAEGERDFANVDLSGEILSGAELNEINLQNALLSETDFSDARLGGANLTGAIATGADLRGVDFSGADLTEANLTNAIMSEVNLTGARLLRANLKQADLNFAVLRGAELMRADLSQTDLSLADLSAANLLLANLNDANLLKANLQESNLSAAELENAQLEAAVLLLADLRSANLKLANLNYADLREVDLSSADLTQANLIGANLSGANLRGTDVNQLASIDGADFTDVVNLADTSKTYFCKIAAGQTFAESPEQRRATRATLDCPN